MQTAVPLCFVRDPPRACRKYANPSYRIEREC
jgi:hypothetical protein